MGVVGRAHGVHGELAVDLRTDEPERRFALGATVGFEDGSQTLTVSRSRWAGSRFLVSFAGIDDRTAAERLRGVVLTAEAGVAETPEAEEEYYDRQLIGLEVLDAEGGSRGVICGIAHLPGQDLLEIDLGSGAPALIPFVAALVPVVDLAAGRVHLAPVAGLLADEAE